MSTSYSICVTYRIAAMEATMVCTFNTCFIFYKLKCVEILVLTYFSSVLYIMYYIPLLGFIVFVFVFIQIF